MNLQKEEPEEYYCSGCGIGVKAEDKVCPNCGAQLDKVVDESEEEAVVIKIFENEIEAELLVTTLKSNGIFAFIQREDPAGMGIKRGATVLVRKIHEEDAVKFLRMLNS